MEEKAKQIVMSYSERIKDRHVFFHPNIPSKKLNNALKKYATKVNKEEVLVLLDNTAFGNAKHGALLTSEYIYAKDIMENAKSTKLNTIKNVSFPEHQFSNKILYVNDEAFINECSPTDLAMRLFAEMLQEMCKVKINIRTEVDFNGNRKEKSRTVKMGKKGKNVIPKALVVCCWVWIGIWLVHKVIQISSGNILGALDFSNPSPAGILAVVCIVLLIINSTKKK